METIVASDNENGPIGTGQCILRLSSRDFGPLNCLVHMQFSLVLLCICAFTLVVFFSLYVYWCEGQMD
jgi:hypothetical protein